MNRKSITTGWLLVVLTVCAAYGQANGKLQIHFMNVGQGDAALLISPQGETILFDNGVAGHCDKPVSYLQQLGLKQIDYHVASHYHADHIGCTTEVLQEFPLQKDALDRSFSYKSTVFSHYLTAIGSHRKTAEPGMKITLDASAKNPVVIEIAALNGDGVKTTNENDLSVVAVVRFGTFDAVIGGDLSGYKQGSYEDIETRAAGKVGQVEVYKVHHHASQYSTNDTWLATTRPMVGVISVGDGNGYGHPTQECLERLHAAKVKTYWTEKGEGTPPEPGQDAVGGNIVVEAEPGGAVFTVTHSGSVVDKYASWGTSVPGPAAAMPIFAWSRRSDVYHYSNCRFVVNIAPGNLVRGNERPEGKRLHEGCPR